MSISNRSDTPAASGLSAWPLWIGICAAIACGLTLAASLVGEPALERRQLAVAELQMRVRQLRSDSVALTAGQPANQLVERFAEQLRRATNGIDAYTGNNDALMPETDARLRPAWQESFALWTAQLSAAQGRLQQRALDKNVTDQLEDARAIALSLARTALTREDLDATLRVAWLQLPVNLANLRQTLFDAVLSPELSAPFADGAASVGELIQAPDATWSPQTRDALEAIQAVLRQIAADLGALNSVAPAFTTPRESDAVATALETVVVDEMASLTGVHTRWVWLRYAAFALGLIGLACLSLAAITAYAALGKLSPALAARYGKLLRRLSAESKRDSTVARALARISRERVKDVKHVRASSQQLVHSSERLAKPRA
ncbi:MAG: hypothetical protein AAF499_02010, partial [Pseudomonadota bacterium]